MKTLFNSIIISFLFTQFLIAQNLVPNPSFETISNPFCGIMGGGDFDETVFFWGSPSAATPLAFFTTNESTCYNHQPLSAYDGPIGLKGSQLPNTGDVFAGIWCYTIADLNQRQYIQVQLDDTLTTGDYYEVSFYVSLGDSMEFAIDQLGAHLSVDAISVGEDSVLNATPQVEVEDFISNSEEWVLIIDTVQATEAFEYLTIGNFYGDNSTNTEANPLASGAPGTYGAYYFIDDVSVEWVDYVSSTPSITAPDFTLFPTLVEDVVEIQFKTTGIDSQISIYTSNGALLHSEQANEDLLSLDFSSYTSGVYLISVMREGVVHQHKVVKE